MRDDVVAAAHTTLASGSARVLRRRFRASGEVVTTEDGVTDFAARRTRAQLVAGDGLAEWAERLDTQVNQRWPWLHDAFASEGGPMVTVYAGTAHFLGAPDAPTPIGNGDPNANRRAPGDPAWMIDALCAARVTSARIDDAHRSFELDLARLHGALEIPPHSASTPPRLVGEAWIDGDGRLRRVTSRTGTYSRRPRSPVEAPTQRGSELLELWDFGVAAEIEVPHIETRLPGAGLVDWARIGWDLRRRRREHRNAAG
ncbi:hypothetical protein OJ997_03715 [Solirubrobacter phytolaccae]|uniref:Uncharacterized protein n=1 Tax=Solirubrobacter phytolaccae TaxID=1404360 RepID=A0A9X3N6T9_9ACTN|nr:hypothetical protein [Solirubrobacter phytolaccae]MDA0179392.1 hypothetical protein [Solirubrobacter phytolaccae]